MRGYLILVWSLLDPLYFFFTRLTYLSCKESGGNIFRIRLTKYKGRSIVLSDGTQINKNDTLVKIHLHNVKLLKELRNIKGEIKRGKIIYRYVQKSLPEVENYIRNHAHLIEIKGIIGVTSLNKGCERLGFEMVSISHPIYKWFKKFAFLPIEILSTNNYSARYILKQHTPNYLFMSTSKLANMYREYPNSP